MQAGALAQETFLSQASPMIVEKATGRFVSSLGSGWVNLMVFGAERPIRASAEVLGSELFRSLGEFDACVFTFTRNEDQRRVLSDIQLLWRE